MRRRVPGRQFDKPKGVFSQERIVGRGNALAADRPFGHPNQQNQNPDNGPADGPVGSLTVEPFQQANSGGAGNDDDNRQADLGSSPHAYFTLLTSRQA